MKYIPPLVSGNNLEIFCSKRDTIGEKGLEVGGYLRISTKKDSQKTSIENQKKYLLEWAKVNGYHIYDFYTDVKSGAYTHLRNNMKKLNADVDAGKVKGIVSKEISRTSRDIMDILSLKRSLDDRGAFFISVKEGYDSRLDDDEFLLIIHAGLAQKERKTTGSRVKITQMIKAHEGKTNVASPAFGYKLSKDKQHLEVNPETSEIYHLIVDKFLDGWGQLKICKHLNARGIKAKRGGKWNTNSIKTILTNPVYLGINIYNVTTRVRTPSGKPKLMVRPENEWVIRENTHEPLITQEKFDRIQEIIKMRKEKDTHEWSCTKKYLLSGLLFCEQCGGKLYGSKIPKNYARKKPRNTLKSSDYYFYYFDKNLSGKCKSIRKSYPMDMVEKKVMEEIKKFFSDTADLEKRIRKKNYLYDQRLGKKRKERETVRQKLEAVEIAIRRQQEAYEKDVLTLEEYSKRMNEIRQLRQSLQEKLFFLDSILERVDRREEEFQIIKDKVLLIISRIDDLDYETKEEIIKKIISKIYINAEFGIRIEYTFEEE